MPTLTIIHDGQRTSGQIARRVTIGRWPTNGVVLDSPEVSRVHAWIGHDEHGWFVADAGSRGGTFVNGKKLRDPVRLGDDDVIRVGRARLRFEQDGRATESSPAFADAREPRRVGREGISFACDCGAPLWAPPGVEGVRGFCRHCGAPIRIPHLSIEALAQAGPEQAVCGICQWPMAEGMDLHHCPVCGLGFHAECWHENGGCSAYGCSGGRDATPIAQSAEVDPGLTLLDAPPGALPREHLLLLASLLGAVLALGSFGAPALIALIAGIFQLRRNRAASRRGVLYAALTIAALGVILGVPASWFWWFGRG